jgi:hypothetical protein
VLSFKSLKGRNVKTGVKWTPSVFVMTTWDVTVSPTTEMPGIGMPLNLCDTCCNFFQITSEWVEQENVVFIITYTSKRICYSTSPNNDLINCKSHD